MKTNHVSAMSAANIKTLWPKLTSSFLIGLGFSLNVAAAQSLATSMQVNIGSSNGSVSALALARENKIVNLYTNNNGNLSVIFKYSSTGLSSSISLSGVLRQSTADDTFTFQALNSSGAWVTIGSTTGGPSDKAIKIALPSGAAVNSVISIRLISSAQADDIDVDQLIIVDNVTTVPTPVITNPVIPSPVIVPITSSLKIPTGTKWYWQLSGTVNTSHTEKVYDIDMFTNSASTFSSLKAAGHIVICYFSAGSYEPNRPDSSQFPSNALGSGLQGWPGEFWLDTRNATVRQIMMNRMDLAKSKGCDGLEPDNVDGYANANGLGLTQADQINYNTFLADQAHQRGLIVALKNATDLVSTLVNKFDFAVNEQCAQYGECAVYAPFQAQNKAVLNAEYSRYSNATCSQTASLGITAVFYNLGLNGSVFQPCP